MFAWEILESFLFIAVITAGVVWCGLAFGRSKDRVVEVGRDTHRKIA